MQNLGNPYTGLPYYPGVSFAPPPLMGSISYPPLSAFIFALIFRLYLLLGEPSRFIYYFLLKQPMIFADIGIAIVLAKIIVASKGATSARLGSLLWLYFPFGIIVSSLWGALDPIALFFVLLSAYYLTTSRALGSAAFLGLAIFLKTIPIVGLPIFLFQLSAVRDRLRYSIVSLSIPVLGTILPLVLLNWGFKGISDNFSFQADIPSYGAMSVLGQLFQLQPWSTTVQRITGILWLPVIGITYLYIYKKRLPLFRGLLVTFLAFSISRVFLPEQWALYPLAMLPTIIDDGSLKHFFGLSAAATAFLIANNALLVSFLTPTIPSLYAWHPLGSAVSSLVEQTDILLLLSTIFSVEALLTISGKESLIYKLVAFTTNSLRVQFTFRRMLTPRSPI